ncbi:MAG: hypothetical protein EP333_09025 [Bacteroidetes bacterium]|nr:MAG: hypothetical protein EP333_09025 [Bacteroidota bacterium]
MKSALVIGMLVVSNVFMTLAWYGHLKFHEWKWFSKLGLFAVILISWGMAFFEYAVQVPANRMGFKGNGGPFSLFELKILQEIITLIVFTLFAVIVFRTETFKVQYLYAFICILLAVYFTFKK